MSIKQQKIQAKKNETVVKQQLTGHSLVKSFTAEFKGFEDKENRKIKVKFADFGSLDSDRDILVKGCFAKSISERGPESKTNRKIAFCWQHDMRDPIGKILSITEEEDGAYAVVQISDPDSVPNAKRTLAQLEDGTLNQFSFGYSYVWDRIEYDEEKDAFIVKEVILYEISVVTLGANEQTEFIGFIQDNDSIKSFIKNLKTLDTEKYNMLVQAIKEADAAPEAVPPTSAKSMFEKLSNIK